MRYTLLELDGLAKRYGKTTALESMDLAVEAGSLTVILGAAGAGKTTTLRLVAGLEEPTGGQIRLHGRDLRGVPPNGRDVAMVFDNLALYPHKTGFDNIASPLRIAGLPRAEVAARVAEVAALMRIAPILPRKPRTMSGGERQRVAFARALVRAPALFLLDEPLSSLDAMLRLELRAELKRLQRQKGYTFLLATPDFAEAMALADRVVLLRRGRVIQVARPQELYDAPADTEAARFVGAPEINLVDAVVDASDGSRLRIGAAVLPLPASRTPELAHLDRFTAGLRPEHLTVVPPGTGPIAGRVVDVESHGLKATVTVAVGDERWRVAAGPASPFHPAIGDRVAITPALDRLRAFACEDGRRLA